MSRNKNEPISLIIEIRDGKAWWVVADHKDRPIEVVVMNHDDGIIRSIPVDYRDAHYLRGITDIIGHMEDDGVYAQFEAHLADINPTFYQRLRELRKANKSGK